MIEYKTVAGPVGLTIDRKDSYEKAVQQCAKIIDNEAVGGWKFEFIQKIPVTKSAGCIASLLGQGDTTVYFNMLVFSKDDSETVSSGPNTAQGINFSNAARMKSDQGINSVLQDGTQQSPVGVNISGGAVTDTNEKVTNNKKIGIIAVAVVAVLAIIIAIALGGKSKSNDYTNADYHTPEYQEPVYLPDDEVSDSAREFCDLAQGVWVDMDSCEAFGDQVQFEFIYCVNGEMCGGYYPGDYFANYQIIDATDGGDGEYTVTLFRPEQDIMGDHYDEYTEERYVIIDGNHLSFPNTSSTEYTYAGADIDEARENATELFYGEIMDEYSTPYDAYNEKISEYVHAILQASTTVNNDDNFDNSSINNFMVWYCHSYDETIGYTLYDIDDNGTPELLFKNEFGSIIDAYTLKKNGRILKLFEDCSFGDLCSLKVLNDSYFLTVESYSANSMSYKLFQFKNDELIDVEAYYYDDTGNKATMDKNYTYVSKAEWYKLGEPLYEKSVVDNLDWITIR